MSKEKFDPSKFSTRAGNVYYNGQRASQYRLRQYQKYVKGAGGRVTSVPKSYSKYFSSGTRFTTREGHLENWAKPLTAKGGKNPNYNWSRVSYKNSVSGEVKRGSSSMRWGTDVNKNKTGMSGSATVLKGTRQWIRQIETSLYQLGVNAEHFRIVVGNRAIKVFQNSFKYQKFYDNQSHKWASLAPYTLRKRASRGTGSRILKEYGDLYNSLKLDSNSKPNTTEVYTDIVHANISHHKKHSICYAGYHNEGKGTYGSAWNGHKPKPYIRRQFMGHSSYLDPFTDSFMRKMMKLYLFDNVFLIKK